MRGVEKSIDAIISNRSSLLTIAIVAVLIGLGINILSSSIIALLSSRVDLSIFVGAALCLIGFALLISRSRYLRHQVVTFTGAFLVLRQDESKIIRIPEYDFSEKIADHFSALFAENKALEKSWFAHSHKAQAKGKPRRAQPLVDDIRKKFVEEAVEYFFLDQLSLHLSAFFENNPKVSNNRIVRFQRNDIPEILLNNRFLHLFSSPLEQRESFSAHHVDDIDVDRIVYTTGKGGAIFDKFELILPKGSKVRRDGAGAIVISTKRFTLRVEVDFSGFSTLLPSKFEQLYLDKEFFSVSPYMVLLHVDRRFRFWSFFSETGWQYYKWSDSMIDMLRSSFDFEAFLRTIDWDKAEAIARIAGFPKQSDSKGKTSAE